MIVTAYQQVQAVVGAFAFAQRPLVWRVSAATAGEAARLRIWEGEGGALARGVSAR